jgi:hypothetical protein
MNSTTTEDIANPDSAKIDDLATCYDMTVHQVETALLTTTVAGDTDPLHIVTMRLIASETDVLLNPRPEPYGEGWESACHDIEGNDAIWKQTSESDPEPPSFGDMLKVADDRFGELRQDCRQYFLSGSQWPEDQRCERWATQGRIDCLTACCELCRIDGDMTSKELAEFFRRHADTRSASDAIAEHSQLIEADKLHWFRNGGTL